MKIRKLARVENCYAHEKGEPVAFQLVEFTLDFYGNKQVFELDTKIMDNGDQLVIDGNGWIKAGTNLNDLA